MKNSKFLAFISVALLIGLAACGGFFVSGNSLQTLTLSPGSTFMGSGDSLTMTANGVTVDGNSKDVTSTATWTSSSPDVATVNGGVVKAVGIGSTTITASADGVDATSVVTVDTIALDSLAVTPSSPSVSTSQGTLQFTATGTLKDGSTRILTNAVRWSSGTTATATINSTGLATLIATGTSTITASVNATSGTTSATKSGTATLNVTF